MQTDHCSDPLDIQFQQACTDHQHDVGCDQLLPKAVLNLKEILSNLAGNLLLMNNSYQFDKI